MFTQQQYDLLYKIGEVGGKSWNCYVFWGPGQSAPWLQLFFGCRTVHSTWQWIPGICFFNNFTVILTLEFFGKVDKKQNFNYTLKKNK